jgi:hypothetical protein
MPVDKGTKKSAIERFFHWAMSSEPADKLMTEEEKLAQGNPGKEKAWKELDEEYAAKPTPVPTPEPTPDSTKKKAPIVLVKK